MKPYVMTTGVVFGLLTSVHLWRLYVEGPQVADPWFILFTVLTAGLGLWAALVLRSSRRS